MTVRRYLPLIDEAGTGNVTAVLDENGNLVERVLYADAYGDAPRYLQGPVVERMTFAVHRTGATLNSVTVAVTLSDPIDESTLAAGVRLATLSSSNAIVATTATAPTLLTPNTTTWTLSAAEWQSLTTNPAASTLEIAVTNQLRTTTWGPAAPVPQAPDWTLKLFPGTATSSTLRVSHRESLSTLTSYATTPTPHTLYEVADLYLAASPTSSTHLFTGFHAAPFVEPANGMAYFRDRWYDPSTGNWLTPDRLGNIDSSNLYAFCAGDPVNCSDPTGLAAAIGKSGWIVATDNLNGGRIRRFSPDEIARDPIGVRGFLGRNADVNAAAADALIVGAGQRAAMSNVALTNVSRGVSLGMQQQIREIKRAYVIGAVAMLTGGTGSVVFGTSAVGVTATGAVAGVATQGASDIYDGRRSSGGQYLKAAAYGVGFNWLFAGAGAYTPETPGIAPPEGWMFPTKAAAPVPVEVAPQPVVEYGPFYRIQNAKDNLVMKSSGMGGGRAPRNFYGDSGFAAFKAQGPGPLPPDANGLEFYTPVEPYKYSIPGYPRWPLGQPGVTEGVHPETGEPMAYIPIRITKMQ